MPRVHEVLGCGQPGQAGAGDSHGERPRGAGGVLELGRMRGHLLERGLALEVRLGEVAALHLQRRRAPAGGGARAAALRQRSAAHCHAKWSQRSLGPHAGGTLLLRAGCSPALPASMQLGLHDCVVSRALSPALCQLDLISPQINISR